jgi:hypothetical protein
MRGPYRSAEVGAISNLIEIISIYLPQTFHFEGSIVHPFYVSLFTVTESKFSEKLGYKFILTKYSKYFLSVLRRF